MEIKIKPVRYTDWKFAWHWSSEPLGSKRTYGNFAFGVEINRHPRFREYLLCFWRWRLGVTWSRNAIIKPYTPICRNADGTYGVAEKGDRVVGVALHSSQAVGDGTHWVEVKR